MAWTPGADQIVGHLITAAEWNSWMGAAGSIQWLRDTRELWTPCSSWHDSSAGTYHSQNTIIGYGCDINDVDDEAFVQFHTPQYFAAIVTASLVVLPLITNAAADWDIESYYAATGEASGTHNESDAATTYNVTTSQWFEVDVSGILTALSAGDNVALSLKIGTNAHRVIVAGLRLQYS